MAEFPGFFELQLTGIVMHFPTNKRKCLIVCAFYFNFEKATHSPLICWIWECGTNPVLLCHFIFSLTILFFLHFSLFLFNFSATKQIATNSRIWAYMKWSVCHATWMRSNSHSRKWMAKWIAIYLLSLNIQRFIGHSLEATIAHAYTLTNRTIIKLFIVENMRSRIVCGYLQFYSNSQIQFYCEKKGECFVLAADWIIERLSFLLKWKLTQFKGISFYSQSSQWINNFFSSICFFSTNKGTVKINIWLLNI